MPKQQLYAHGLLRKRRPTRRVLVPIAALPSPLYPSLTAPAEPINQMSGLQNPGGGDAVFAPDVRLGGHCRVIRIAGSSSLQSEKPQALVSHAGEFVWRRMQADWEAITTTIMTREGPHI